MKTNTAAGGEPARNSFIRRRSFAPALGGFLFAATFALSAAPAKAQCAQWQVGHGWRFKQGPTVVHMSLRQNGMAVRGKANFVLVESSAAGFFGRMHSSDTITGDVDGSVNGNQFGAVIHWNNNTTGVYEGTIDPDGWIEGKGWERRSPRTKVNWHSETRMVCPDAVPAGTKPGSSAATKAELEAAGDAWLADEVRKRKAASQPTPSSTNKQRGFIPGFGDASPPAPTPKEFTPTQGEAGKATRPYLRALPQIVSIPRGESEALTKLVWYAGNDHPDAQLVVEVNGGDETLVDSQRKGSRQVKVKAGRKYVYALVDNGVPLATVIVQADQSAPPDRLRGNQRGFRQDVEGDNDQIQGDE